MAERKRIVHMEIDERTFVNTDGLNSGLAGLARQAEDSHDFEDILNNAIQSLYKAQPQGEDNYGREHSRIGRVRLCRFNNRQEPGNTNIEYIPSNRYKSKWKYVQRGIGTINLRERIYSTSWKEGDYREGYYEIPEVLMKDTEVVMKCLGLTRKVKE